MKITSILITSFLLALNAAATVRVVNNNNPSPGQYSTPTAALAASSAGDTILITGSVYNYNDLTITKRITIIGTGHSPATPNPATSKLDNIDFSGTASNLYDVNLIGLDVNSISYNVANTKRQYVSRCQIRSYLYLANNQDSILIDGNYFLSSGNCLQAAANYNFNNITFRNNVFNGSIYQYYPSGSSGYNLYFNNNLFLVNQYVFTGSNRYLVFRNNIFYRADPNSAAYNCDFDYNLIYKAYSGTNNFPTSNGNVSGTHNLLNVDPVFTSFPNNGDYYSYNYNFTLQSTSTALNAGSDGKDIGLSGGDGYFQKFGIPAIPQINELKITSPSNATIAPGGNLQISVKSSIGR